jgi:hypothetical protein
MQLFERRSKQLRGDNERKLWGQISPHYMTDEETDDDDGGFVTHKLTWRSKHLDFHNNIKEQSRQKTQHKL